MNAKNTRDAILICLVMASSTLANAGDDSNELDENGAFKSETPRPRYVEPAWDEVTDNKRAQRLADRASDATIDRLLKAKAERLGVPAENVDLTTEDLAEAWAEAAAWLEGGWQKPGDELLFVMPKPKKHTGNRVSSSGSDEVAEAIASDAPVAEAEQAAAPTIDDTIARLNATPDPSDEELSELEEDPIGYDMIPAGGMGEPVS